MKRFLIAGSIVAISLLAPKANAQDVIAGKQWHSVSSTDGKISIPDHCVITFIGTSLEARGIERINVGVLSYRFQMNSNYTFSGEMYTGEKPLEISIEGAKKETVISVTYYK